MHKDHTIMLCIMTVISIQMQRQYEVIYNYQTPVMLSDAESSDKA